MTTATTATATTAGEISDIVLDNAKYSTTTGETICINKIALYNTLNYPNISDEMVWDASNNPYEVVYWVVVGDGTDGVLKRGLWG